MAFGAWMTADTTRGIRGSADSAPPAECPQWVEPRLLPELIVPFKRDMYRAIVDRFSDWL